MLACFQRVLKVLICFVDNSKLLVTMGGPEDQRSSPFALAS